MSSIVYIVTSDLSAHSLLRGQLSFMRDRGHDVTVICSPGRYAQTVAEREGVKVMALPLARDMSPAADAAGLLRMTKLLAHLEPDIVNASTPKAALLGLLAATALRVPHRIYTVRGLRYETTTGARRHLLRSIERLCAGCAHRVIAVSPSVRRTYIEEGLCHPSKIGLLGAGSSNGVNADRFLLDERRVREARQLRLRLGIPVDAPVLGFVGRFTRDKGFAELWEAFRQVRQLHPKSRLLLVGDFEPDDPVDQGVRAALTADSDVVITGFVDDVVPYYAMMSLLLFPSHREGFPNAPVEAACCAIPTVGFAATGTVDAVLNDVTGSLAPVGDVQGLSRAILRYLQDPELRNEHGRAARERAVREFRPEAIWSQLASLYDDLLGHSVTDAALHGFRS